MRSGTPTTRPTDADNSANYRSLATAVLTCMRERPMINAITTLAPRNRLRTDWLLRLVLIAGFPLAATAPLLGGLLASQGPVSRQQRELAEEEIAIRCPVTSNVRRVAETGGRFFTISSPRVRVHGSHSKCASTREGVWVTFRAAGHRLDLATSAPLLC